MSSFVSRLVACLVAVVAVLQLVHLVLLNQLEHRRLDQLTQIQHQFHPLPPEESFLGFSNNFNLKPPSPQHQQYRQSSSTRRIRKLVGNNYGSGYGRGVRVDFNENEVLMERLFNDDEGTIVDSSGEYRVVFDIAGPQRDSLSQPPSQSQPLQQQQPINLNLAVEKVAPLLSGNGNNDDFSIDEDITDQEPPPSQDVTLVTHGDLPTAKKYLIPLIERWNGPVSLVLFATNSSSVEATLAFIAHVRLCSDEVRQHVNFHIVFPLVETHLRYTATNGGSNKRLIINKTRLEKQNKKTSGSSWSGSSSKNRKSSSSTKNTNNNYSAGAIIDLETECQYFQEQRESSKFYKNSRENSGDPLDLSSGGGSGVMASSNNNNNLMMMSSSYPTNLLRNVGRKRVLTDYSLVIPLYMLPSEGLRSKFHKMVKRRKGVDEKTVFVIPSFETKNEEMPKSKVELLKLLQNYQARPYKFELCWKCLVQTDYESWGRETGKEEELSVMYEVLWKDPWEPYFISENSVPLFDEGFRHITFDRLSQLCELHVAGYKFQILNEPFLLHPGYITPTPFHLQQLNKNTNSNILDTNRSKFRQFKHELKNRYPHSTRRCF